MTASGLSILSLLHKFSIAPLPVNQVKHLLSTFPPLQIRKQHIKRPLAVLCAQPTNMRRDDDILGIPQRIVLRQRLRIHDVERGTAQLAVVQRLDQSGLVDDLAARDVDHEGAAAGENVEFGSAEQVRRRGRQGQGYDQHVEVLGQERVQVGFVGGRARVPGDGDRAVRVASAGDVVALVGAGRGRCARGGGVGEDVCAEGGEGAGHWGGLDGLGWDAEVHWDRREEGLLGGVLRHG